jgi:hypothetical protein
MVKKMSWQMLLCGSFLVWALGCSQGSTELSPSEEASEGKAGRWTNTHLINPSLLNNLGIGGTGQPTNCGCGSQPNDTGGSGTGGAGTGGSGTGGSATGGPDCGDQPPDCGVRYCEVCDGGNYICNSPDGKPGYYDYEPSYVFSIHNFHTRDSSILGSIRILSGTVTAIWPGVGFFMQEGVVDRNNRDSVEFHSVFVELLDPKNMKVEEGKAYVAAGISAQSTILGVRVLRAGSSLIRERSEAFCGRVNPVDWYVLSPDEVVAAKFDANSMIGVLVLMPASLLNWPEPASATDSLLGEACKWVRPAPYPTVKVEAPQDLYQYGWQRAHTYLNLTGIFMGVTYRGTPDIAASVRIAPRFEEDVTEQNDACL